MGQDPREAWRKLQQTLANAQQQGRRGLGGSPKGAFSGAAGVVLLVGGYLVFNNALFNGITPFRSTLLPPAKTSSQSTEVIELSSTRG